jgi:hypothetical protein
VRRLAIMLLLVLACRPTSRARFSSPTGVRDTAPAPTLIVHKPTVVAFWLAAADSLGHADSDSLSRDFENYTRLVAPLLEEQDIELKTTHADSIVVEREGAPRRVVMLSGLDYPFGYVLIDPGFAERIVTGVSTDDELLDEIDWYFGVDEEDGDSGSVHVTQAGSGWRRIPPPP